MSYFLSVIIFISSIISFASGSFSYEVVDQFEDQELEILSSDFESALVKISGEFKVTRIIYQNLPEGNYPEHIVHHLQSKIYPSIDFNFIGRFENDLTVLESRLSDMLKEEELLTNEKAIKFWAKEIADFSTPKELFNLAKGQLIYIENENSKQVQSFLLMTPDESLLLVERIQQ